MNKREFYYPSADGKTTIHAVEWLPENVRHYKGIIQIAHGLSEHIGLYEPIAKYFTDKGFIVRGNDHLGHGYSVLEGEPRLYLGPRGSWHFASDDIYTCRMLTEKEYGELPYIMLGFSLGSYLIRDYLIRYADSVDAAVLVGCLSFPKVATFFGKIIANILAVFLGEKSSPKILDFFVNETNNLQIKNRRGYLDWINENEDEVKRLMADPFAMETISIGLFRELLYAIKFTGDIKNIAKMNKDNPIVFISGKDDPAVRGGKTIDDLVKKFKYVGIKDVSYKLYEGRHRVLFEKTGEMTLDKIYDWACSKLKTEDINAMEKSNPMLGNALKSMIVLAKAGVKEADELSGHIFDALSVEEKNKKLILNDFEKEYKDRFDRVTQKIDELISEKKIDVIVDIGAGFGVRGLLCQNKNIDYIGVDLPAVVAEAKNMHKQFGANIKMKVADICNYESIKRLNIDKEKKILLLIENVDENLFDFELKFEKDNINLFLKEYNAICLKSEKNDIYEINRTDTNLYKEVEPTSSFNLSHLTSDGDVIIKVEGVVDSLSSPKLLDYVEGLTRDLEGKNLIINMVKVNYILPAGLNVMEEIEKKYPSVEWIFKRRNSKNGPK